MWIVKIIRPPVLTSFPRNFFPRVVRYKVDALEYKRQVEHEGGVATIEKQK